MNTTEAETYRREILGYCYRYFGCIAEAEDATQETMLRAWRARDGAEFGGRSSLRTWLYSIATHVCLDMARAPQRRSLPVDLNLDPPIDCVRWAAWESENALLTWENATCLRSA